MTTEVIINFNFIEFILLLIMMIKLLLINDSWKIHSHHINILVAEYSGINFTANGRNKIIGNKLNKLK
jgi:hypothetical protein